MMTHLRACLNSMTSFANFTANDNDIRLVHQNIAPDTDLAKLADSYKDIQLMRNSSGSVQPAATARSVLRVLCQNGEDQNNALAVTLSRVLVCKPHSADCERLISAYNLLKTNSRSSLERDTITDYLYVRINMPPLVEFDPRPAVLHWLTDKKRRQKDTPKATQQDWFRQVFDNNADDCGERPDF